MTTVSRLRFRAGALIRREARARAAQLGLDVQEFKGWLESWFVVSGPSWDVLEMYHWLDPNAAADAHAALAQQEFVASHPNGAGYFTGIKP